MQTFIHWAYTSATVKTNTTFRSLHVVRANLKGILSTRLSHVCSRWCYFSLERVFCLETALRQFLRLGLGSRPRPKHRPFGRDLEVLVVGHHCKTDWQMTMSELSLVWNVSKATKLLRVLERCVMLMSVALYPFIYDFIGFVTQFPENILVLKFAVLLLDDCSRISWNSHSS